MGGVWGFYSKLRSLKHQLRIWNKEVLGNIFDAIANVEAEVTHCERAYDTVSTVELQLAYHRSVALLRLAQSRALLFWKQRRMLNGFEMKTLTLSSFIRQLRNVQGNKPLIVLSVRMV